MELDKNVRGIEGEQKKGRKKIEEQQKQKNAANKTQSSVLFFLLFPFGLSWSLARPNKTAGARVEYPTIYPVFGLIKEF
jgi:hypothetical protein